MITLNRKYVINKALQVLLLQSYPRRLLHVVIVDGGSIDRTVEICRNVLSGQGLQAMILLLSLLLFLRLGIFALIK